MAGWLSSTQRARWIFKAEDLAEQRKLANERAAAHVIQVHEQAQAGTVPDSSAAVQDMSAARPDTSTTAASAHSGSVPGQKGKRGREGQGQQEPEPLAVEEEQELIRFYEWKLVEVCRAFQFPFKVQSTAIQFLKRFFLRHSVMEFDPKSIMLTVVYVACKIDESYVSAEALGNGIKQDPQVILANELTVLQALEFDLICHGPYRPLQGFLDDWQDRFPHHFGEAAAAAGAGSRLSVELVKDEAQSRMPQLLATDALLLFTPAQVALAALSLAFTPPSPFSESLPLLQEFFEALGEQSKGTTSLQGTITNILDLQQPRPDEAKVKKINSKLRHCKDPSLRQEESKRKKEKKEMRAKKVTEECTKVDGGAG